MTLTEPECPYGYPHSQLERELTEAEYASLRRQLDGQTQSICDGRLYSHERECYYDSPCVEHPHGLVAYKGDVQEWVEGKPVSDW